MRVLYFSLILLLISSCISSCSTSQEKSSLEALPKARAYVEQYGQVVSAAEARYLQYLEKKLSSVLAISSGKKSSFQIILLNTKDPIASYAGTGMILISRGIVISLQSEAELAFLIAHEMAHEHLNHDPESLLEEKDENSEIAADRLAAATISAAGYDPRLAIQALKNTYRYASPFMLNENKYPSLEHRIDELIEFIDSSGWKPPGIVNRREFRDFRQALQ